MIFKKRSHQRDLSNGFTIVELIISVSILAVLVFVASDLLISVLQNPTSQMTSMDNIEQAKTVASTFVEELRNAATGNDGSYSLTQAGDNQIIFYSNFGTSGIVVNRIRYYLSGNTLYKGVVIPTGSPLSYNLSSEVVRAVNNVVSNGSNPVFYYYNGNYNGTASTSPLTQPINVNQVRFVRINLMIKNQTTSQNNSTFPISAGATIRNLKDNLGN